MTPTRDWIHAALAFPAPELHNQTFPVEAGFRQPYKTFIFEGLSEYRLMNIPRKRLFWAVGLGHMVNDIFMSMGPTVLTFLASTAFPISKSQIGLADGLRQLVGAFSQPFFGWLADKTGGRRLGAGGVAWTVSVMCLGLLLALWTKNFWVMLLPYVFSAVGSGAFHPVGALHAAESDEKRVASSVSWFFLMGQFGLALGPLLAGWILQRSAPGDISSVFLLAPLAIPCVILMALNIPGTSAHQATHPRSPRTADSPPLNLPIKAGLILLVVVALRSLAQPGAATFISPLFEDKGWTPAEYGMATSVFWLASGLTGVWFGGLADRFDRRLVLAVGLVASAPAFYLLPASDGMMGLVLSALAGGLSGASHSIIVVLAQELIPSGKGFASGAIMGTIFGVGAVGSLMIGSLSDSIGIENAFHVIAVMVGISGVAGLLLPKENPTAEAVVAPAGD
jgi:MFS transporter, FSR family, fosmidomycin resistance protein